LAAFPNNYESLFVTTRIVVGLVGAPLVLALIWFGGVWCLLLFLAIALYAGFEFYSLTAQAGYRPARLLGLLWITGLVLAAWRPGLPYAIPVLTTGMAATLIYALFQTEKPLSAWMTTSAGAVYIGLMMAQVLALRLLPGGLWWLLFGLLITWANDTAAYFVGVTAGRHKLWPRLSPKKTWEGTIGGWLAAIFLGGLLALWFPLSKSFAYGATLGAVCGVLALLGDLAISMVKRQVGVKDSGKLFPGHGGMLDRIDSILFVLPFLYQALTLFS
jgi:phosphatidate cytidylyltransferase